MAVDGEKADSRRRLMLDLDSQVPDQDLLHRPRWIRGRRAFLTRTSRLRSPV